MHNEVKKKLVELKYRISCMYSCLENMECLIDLTYEKDALGYVVELIDHALLCRVSWNASYLDNLLDEYTITVQYIQDRLDRVKTGDFSV